jgi:uncharacterized protein (DUF433 family)
VKSGLFTAKQVCALCEISQRQLAYWDKTGFFSPKHRDEDIRPFKRIYTFRDVVGLRTIGLLRNNYRVPLTPDLRRISRDLKKTPDSDWSHLVFYRDPTKRIYFAHPKTKEIVSTSPFGQRPLFEMREVIQHIERNLKRMNRRQPTEIGKIERNRYIVHNATVIAGTRIPTAAIYRFHKAGYPTEQIIREFPRLTAPDVEAAIQLEQRAAG